MTTSIEVLAKAQAIQQQRAKEYGAATGERSFEAIGKAFNAITGRSGEKALTTAEVALLLQILKQVRLFASPGFHQDSAEDNVSYGALLAELKYQEANPEQNPEQPGQRDLLQIWREIHGREYI